MRRFGGAAGGVSTRFRGVEDRVRKLGAVGAWLCSVLLLGLAAVPTASAQTVTYIHTDALGSVVAKSDANGNVIERITYEPYGAVVGAPVADGPGYTGHVSDAATGLSYMQQRYIDPQLGVFLSVDPVAAYEQPLGQFNRYRYANGNPYKFTDPDGRYAILVPLVVVPLIAGTLYYATTTPEQRTDLGSKLEGAIKGLTQKSEQGSREPALQGDGSIVSEGKSGNRFPDRPLPTKASGEPAPDPDSNGPHTQLGQREGSKGKYDQAREFDGQGRPVKTIDFTDHGRPGSHTNPHEHPYESNGTGGTPSRAKARPLNGGEPR